ncbi:MAG: RtcB family protein [Flavobacteriales bacterium]
MANQKLRGKDLSKIGFTTPKTKSMAMDVVEKHYKHFSKNEKLSLLEDVLLNAEKYIDHDFFDKLAAEFYVVVKADSKEAVAVKRESGAYNVFGREHIASNAIQQMDQVMRLPIAVKGALMPDAHQGYGLPIGGVLASETGVIPYGVGVDIGCRMCLSIYDIRPSYLDRYNFQLTRGLIDQTRFGTGEGFDNPVDDDLFDRAEFREIPLLKNLLNKARFQIGSSGSGNHFVEFGAVALLPDNAMGLPAGEYVGLLSHSGSRGLGAAIANHYTKLATEKCLLPREVRHLAWLDINSAEGTEYWLAMNLAGDYAKACHNHIHRRLGKVLGEKALFTVENHHNFAWKEIVNGREMIVHRKGATPAHSGELAVIPGTMIHPGYIVSGKGEEASLNSASHGAGREMSRSRARESVTRSELNKILQKAGVTLVGGGLDEAPIAYKNIDEVMKSQRHLINIEGTIRPKIVRMDKN